MRAKYVMSHVMSHDHMLCHMLRRDKNQRCGVLHISVAKVHGWLHSDREGVSDVVFFFVPNSLKITPLTLLEVLVPVLPK